MKALHLLACQVSVPITPDAEARNAHVAALCKRLENAAIGQDLDLIVLPELSSMEYSDLAFTRLNALAEPGDGPTFQCFSALAQKLGTAIVFGFARQSERGTTICQAAIAPSGGLAGAITTNFTWLNLAHLRRPARLMPVIICFAFRLRG